MLRVSYFQTSAGISESCGYIFGTKTPKLYLNPEHVGDVYTDRKDIFDVYCEGENGERLLVDSLKDHGVLSRGEIDKLLWNVISDQLDDTQKKTKIGNILRKLRKDGIMQNETKGNVSNWSLVK
jgi:hypothetical protein